MKLRTRRRAVKKFGLVAARTHSLTFIVIETYQINLANCLKFQPIPRPESINSVNSINPSDFICGIVYRFVSVISLWYLVEFFGVLEGLIEEYVGILWILSGLGAGGCAAVQSGVAADRWVASAPLGHNVWMFIRLRRSPRKRKKHFANRGRTRRYLATIFSHTMQSTNGNCTFLL